MTGKEQLDTSPISDHIEVLKTIVRLQSREEEPALIILPPVKRDKQELRTLFGFPVVYANVDKPHVGVADSSDLNSDIGTERGYKTS